MIPDPSHLDDRGVNSVGGSIVLTQDAVTMFQFFEDPTAICENVVDREIVHSVCVLLWQLSVDEEYFDGFDAR